METLTQELLKKQYIPGNLYSSNKRFSIWKTDGGGKPIGILKAYLPFMILEIIASNDGSMRLSLKVCQDNLIGWIDDYYDDLYGVIFRPWKP